MAKVNCNATPFIPAAEDTVEIQMTEYLKHPGVVTAADEHKFQLAEEKLGSYQFQLDKPVFSVCQNETQMLMFMLSYSKIMDLFEH